MGDTRVLGFISLAFLSLLIYQAWLEDYAVVPVETEQQTDQAVIADDIPDVVDNVSGEVNSDIPTADVENKAVVFDAEAESSAPIITVETDTLKIKIDTRGGSVIQADLKKYPVELKQPDQLIQLFNNNPEDYYAAQSGLRSAKQVAPDHHAVYQSAKTHYELLDEDKLQIPLTWSDPSGLQVTKLFTFERSSHLIKIEHIVNNQSAQPWAGQQYRQLQRNGQEEEQQAFIYTYTGGVIYSPEEKYEKISFGDMQDEQLSRSFAGGWVSMIQHYFLSAWVPANEEEINRYYSKAISTSTGPRYILGLLSPKQKLAPGEQATFESKLYVGPKEQKALEQIATGLELTVDYGKLTILSKPLFSMLSWFHDFTGNWGWAIIFVTLMIKILFYWPSKQSYKSMAKMRKVQPKLMAIRERHADDRQRQSMAMMELYKTEKINPLGGCLPMLIQIPVFIALYWVLLESVEMRQATFALWINDLSSKDPYFVLPVIMGVTMYIQQKLNPAPTDPVQQKVFAMLPIIFTVFFAFFPAGLVLYWVVNNILTISQQWFITKRVLAEK